MDVRDPERWSAERSAPGGVVPGSAGSGGSVAHPGALAPVLEAFLSSVVSLVGARAGVIRSVASDGLGMRVVAMCGLPEDVRRREAAASQCGICGDALRCADMRVAADAASCSEIASDGIFHGENGGTVAVPLDYKGRTVGVFTLFFDGVSTLRAEVIHVMRPIGQLLGVTLENAKLQNERLHASLIQERQAMAGDIHDSLAQSLTFVRMRMPLLQDAIAEKQTARALKYVRDVYDEVGSANRRLRTLITHFRAGMDAQGLRHALQETSEGFFERTGIELAFEDRAPQLRLAEDAEVQVFHLVQEALANIHKHSQARHARLVVACEGADAVITVEDDGIGWEQAQALVVGDAQPRGHFGLQIMRERAAAAGGRLEFGRSEAGGTRLRVVVPRANGTPR